MGSSVLYTVHSGVKWKHTQCPSVGLDVNDNSSLAVYHAVCTGLKHAFSIGLCTGPHTTFKGTHAPLKIIVSDADG